MKLNVDKPALVTFLSVSSIDPIVSIYVLAFFSVIVFVRVVCKFNLLLHQNVLNSLDSSIL